jgi:UDP-glucose 4-epimerase
MIFVTGGAGYIGSHTCVELLDAGYDVTVFDNFCNSHPEAVARVERIAGKKLRLMKGDIRDRGALVAALRESGASAVIHFAGLKAVGESVTQPLAYYDNNVVGTLRLLEAMRDCGIKTLVFSSSATVYGDPQRLPLTEDHPLSATNPYGRTKLMIEEILRDLHCSDASWRLGILRYFNPVGAHASGSIGEDPPDGTGVRDYIHVVDLALGHLKALNALERLEKKAECLTVNLGTGTGYSVLDIVRAFEQASGRSIPYKIAPRRSGDIASCYADPQRALELLGWRAERGLGAMCADSWRWQSGNPTGYAG